jgi:D-glycero-D-manno-heptose 1,7-bisphosphate phosphatase
LTMNLIIFDKDGTLICPKSGGVFPRSPDDQKLLPNVAAKLEAYLLDGWSMAIASNQGGCDSIDPKTGKAYKTVEDAIEEMRYAMELTGIKQSFFCPDFNGNECVYVDCFPNKLGTNFAEPIFLGKEEVFPQEIGFFRKPSPGMIRAAIENRLPWSSGGYDRVIFVGDRPEDEGAAIAAGVEFQWAKDFFGWES